MCEKSMYEFTRTRITPEGSGYMPLWCAVEWIVTKGQAVDSNTIADEDPWKAAYRALLDAIAGENIKAIGLWQGLNEPIPACHFASCPVEYPWADFSMKLAIGEELYLRSCMYIDDEHWRNGFDDALTNRHGDKWQRIMVSKSDVALLWPFTLSEQPKQADLAITHSGAPGRPTSMHLVEIEHSARWDRGEALDSMAAEAEALAQWLRDKHPSAPRLKPKTICNNLGRKHRRRKNAQK